jgi:hypothetical protein
MAGIHHSGNIPRIPHAARDFHMLTLPYPVRGIVMKRLFTSATLIARGVASMREPMVVEA